MVQRGKQFFSKSITDSQRHQNLLPTIFHTVSKVSPNITYERGGSTAKTLQNKLSLSGMPSEIRSLHGSPSVILITDDKGSMVVFPSDHHQ